MADVLYVVGNQDLDVDSRTTGSLSQASVADQQSSIATGRAASTGHEVRPSNEGAMKKATNR